MTGFIGTPADCLDVLARLVPAYLDDPTAELAAEIRDVDETRRWWVEQSEVLTPDTIQRLRKVGQIVQYAIRDHQ